MKYAAAVFAIALASSCPAVAQQGAEVSAIGYPSVAAALEAMKARRDVSISEQGGWTIVSDPASKSLWSFTPEAHSAHPAVVRRMVVQRGDEIVIDMKGLCQASKAACDKLMAEFDALNVQIRENMKRR